MGGEAEVGGGGADTFALRPRSGSGSSSVATPGGRLKRQHTHTGLEDKVHTWAAPTILSQRFQKRCADHPVWRPGPEAQLAVDGDLG